MNGNYKLTQYSHGSGCGCKIAPDVLKTILQQIKSPSATPELLVGLNHADDAAVIRLHDDLCLISTTDFFMPVVDDAFDYGAIAAANALSDVYAMGGKPIIAIVVLGWPVDTLPASLATNILNGAISVCEQAGITLAGGHTINNKEPFFGLAVNGLVKTAHLKQNHTATAGNTLFLTKALGTGILNTALKRELIAANEIIQATDSMKQLNHFGAVAGQYDFVRAMTDVTGFGLIGHLLEMIQPNQLSAELYYNELLFFDGVKKLTASFVYADNTMRNWKAYSELVDHINGESLLTLCDPQTSGGLLIAVDDTAVSTFTDLLIQHGLGRFARPVGHIDVRKEKPITIRYDCP